MKEKGQIEEKDQKENKEQKENRVGIKSSTFIIVSSIIIAVLLILIVYLSRMKLAPTREDILRTHDVETIKIEGVGKSFLIYDKEVYYLEDSFTIFREDFTKELGKTIHAVSPGPNLFVPEQGAVLNETNKDMPFFKTKYPGVIALANSDDDTGLVFAKKGVLEEKDPDKLTSVSLSYTENVGSNSPEIESFGPVTITSYMELEERPNLIIFLKEEGQPPRIFAGLKKDNEFIVFNIIGTKAYKALAK